MEIDQTSELYQTLVAAIIEESENNANNSTRNMENNAKYEVETKEEGSDSTSHGWDDLEHDDIATK